MSENTTSPEREGVIRTVAYELWEKEGRPNGRDKEHWEQAARIVEIKMTAVDKSAVQLGEQIAGVNRRHGERARPHVHG